MLEDVKICWLKNLACGLLRLSCSTLEGCLCVPLVLGGSFLLIKSVSDSDILIITLKSKRYVEGTLMKPRLVHDSQCCLLCMREPV